MKAIIYCRVSTKEQAEQGYSLGAQEKDCRKFAEDNGYVIDKIFVERGESAKTQNRTQLQKLIKYSVENKKNLSALIIWKYDRLARNLTDQTELVKHFSTLGIKILSVTENNENNSVGRLMRNIIGSFSQYENDIKSERTKNGMKQAMQEGRWCWGAPLGYRFIRDDRNKPLLTPSEDSRFVVEIFRLVETGLYKQTEVLAELRKRGMVRKLTKTHLTRLLRNSLYAGLIKSEWSPDYVEAIHKPIIAKETFFKVQAILDGRRPTIVPKIRNNPDFPLRNFVRCGKCGEKLTGGWSKGRSKKYAYYRCRGKGCSLNIKKEVLDERFIKYLELIQPNQEVIALFKEIVFDVWNNQQEENLKAKQGLEKDLKALEEKKNRIFDLMLKKTIDEGIYKEKFEEVRQEILVKTIELNETKIELNDVESCLNYCQFFLSNIARLWSDAQLDLRQRFQKLIFPAGITFDGKFFRTAEMSNVFKYLQPENLPKSHWAAPRGFEPLSDG